MIEVQLKLQGAWGPLIRKLAAAPLGYHRIQQQILLSEAEFFRTKIVQGLRDQAPGGKKFAPLSPWTIATRRLLGFSGEKALIHRADLMRSIAVIKVDGGTVGVGVAPGAVNSEGKDLSKIAEIQEKGAGPYALKVTPKMAVFLAAVARHLPGAEGRGPGPAYWLSRGEIIITIPPRPFIAPVYEKYGGAASVAERLNAKMAGVLRAVFGL